MTGNDDHLRRLSGKTALVTGTSPNIGGGLVEALADAGASIIAVDANAENAEKCAAAVNAAGGRAVAVTCDVTDEAQVEAAVRTGIEEFGGIDILVNNAATFNRKGVLDMNYDEWLRQTEIILGGAFLFTRAVALDMVARSTQGVIVNVISTAGHQGEPGNIAYGTAKGGLMNFTRSAAMELARNGIRVVSLTPTATDPDEMEDRARRWGMATKVPDATKAVFRKFAAKTPMQKLPSPSDYGKALVFLASDDAAMISGSDLRVDCGAVARYWAWDPSGT